MKHLLVLLGVAVSFACPLRSFATSPVIITGRAPKWVTYTEVVGEGKNQVIYYHTNLTLVGSHLPVVMRAFQGQLDIVGGGRVDGRIYGTDMLKGSGLMDVRSGLKAIDPSFSIH